MIGRYVHPVATLHQHCRIVPYHIDRQSEVVELGSFGTDAGHFGVAYHDSARTLLSRVFVYKEGPASRRLVSLGAFDVYSAFHFSLAVRRMQLPNQDIMVSLLSSKCP